jgi:two-component system OmpR family sensor kinase
MDRTTTRPEMMVAEGAAETTADLEMTVAEGAAETTVPEPATTGATGTTAEAAMAAKATTGTTGEAAMAPETTEAESEGPGPDWEDAEPRRTIRERLSGIRVRILVWYVLLLAAATVASVLVVRQVLLARLDERIDSDLTQETEELRRLSAGNDPETGEPFGNDVARILEVFLQRNVPSRNEAHLTFLDGRPYLRSRAVAPYQLDQDRDLTTELGSVRDTRFGTEETPAGPVRYVAVPLRVGGETRGVFVAAIFRDLEAGEITPAVEAAAGVGIVVLLLGTILAWRLARRILRPVAAVRTTALTISESDLTQRIPVAGHDEISMLAATFNRILDRLERAFRTQRAFVDDAGHELRTPITIIRGHLELLDEDPRERGKTIGLVTDELDRMARIVNDLLILARAEQPDFLDMEVVDAQALTEEVHAKAAALAPRRWEIDEVAHGRVVADRQRLTQALVQLAQNATSHTAEGDLVALGSAIVNGEARFWVRDTGPGIRPEEQKRIFERFSRAADGRRTEGAGLGLAIVRAIAVAHGGRVEVHSRPGAGATFTIRFPVDQPVPAGGEA